MTMGADQFRIAEMMERGATLGEVEKDVISVAPLDSDAKAGLWLFAWAFSPLGRHRDHAGVAHWRKNPAL